MQGEGVLGILDGFADFFKGAGGGEGGGEGVGEEDLGLELFGELGGGRKR